MSKPRKLKVKLPSGDVKELNISNKPDWIRNKFTHREALNWMSAGFNADQARTWRLQGLDHIEAKRLKNQDFIIGVVPNEIRWLMKEFENEVLSYKHVGWAETISRLSEDDKKNEEEISRLFTEKYTSDADFKERHDKVMSRLSKKTEKVLQTTVLYMRARFRILARQLIQAYKKSSRIYDTKR